MPMARRVAVQLCQVLQRLSTGHICDDLDGCSYVRQPGILGLCGVGCQQQWQAEAHGIQFKQAA